MTKHDLGYVGCLILFLFIFATGPILAQTPKRMGPGSPEEIKRALTAVEANLDSLKAHKKFMYAMGYDNPLLLDQYEAWMKKYPNNVNIPLSVGTVFHNAEMPQAKDFLLRAAALDPQNAKVWFMLSADADMRGQDEVASEYIKKAALLDPSNARYAYGYLMSFENSDPSLYKEKVFDFIQRFPTDELGAQAMYWLAERTTDVNDKILYLETLRELYPSDKFARTTSRMRGLADAYLQTDPQKAIMLINEVGDESDTDWSARKEIAESLLKIDKLERDKNYRDAIVKLDQIKLPTLNYISDFIALKKASLQESAGDVPGAYSNLSMKFAKLPTDALFDALILYGKKMRKEKGQIIKEIEVIRKNAAVAAYPFDLGLYTSSSKLALNALKGKVVFLTFWFPGCGPCKAEFPHFQAVVDSFKDDSLVYLGVNVFPSQDGYVIPFVKNNKYSFIPLRGSISFASQKYGAPSQPANFLIDKGGNIVFRDFRIDNTNRRTLELMISSLIEKPFTEQ